MVEEDWFSPENINREIESQSQKRRADPLHCLSEFLSDFWAEHTEEEARQDWQSRVVSFPAYTRDCLDCLESILAAPPPALEAFVREQGGVYLYHDDEEAAE